MDALVIDGVAPISSDSDLNLHWALIGAVGIGHWQADLQFREACVSSGDHQKNNDHEQNINKGHQIDFGFVRATFFSEIHTRLYTRP